jgi:hypothetical protein
VHLDRGAKALDRQANVVVLAPKLVDQVGLFGPLGPIDGQKRRFLQAQVGLERAAELIPDGVAGAPVVALGSIDEVVAETAEHRVLVTEGLAGRFEEGLAVRHGRARRKGRAAARRRARRRGARQHGGMSAAWAFARRSACTRASADTVKTETGAERKTRSVTLPSNACARPRRPCVPPPAEARRLPNQMFALIKGATVARTGTTSRQSHGAWPGLA